MHRILFVGLGVIADEWLEVIRQRTDCSIVGVVVHRDTVAAEEKLSQFGFSAPVYTDFDIALQELKPDIVADLAYPMAHMDITLKSFEAGCAVFGEKPMCMTYEEGLRLLEASKRYNLPLNIMENRRYLPAIIALHHAIANNVLGNIWMTCCEIYVNADLRSVRNTLPFPMLQDQAIHSFDSARYILGTDAKSVYCHSYNPPESHYNGDGCGACIFEMKNGSVLVYNAVMDTNVMKTAWHSQWRIIGSKGTASWNGFDRYPVIESLNEQGEAVRSELYPPEDWNGKEWFAGALEEMISAYDEKREATSSCFDNFESMKMVFSAIESAQKKEKVQIQ